jgi:large subunit ribosomal protein L10
MPKPEKVEKVAALEQRLEEFSLAVFTDFRGLSAHHMTQLRRQLRETGASYQVVKNTLLRFALGNRGVTDFDALLDGPTAIAFSQGDETVTPRLLQEFIRANRSPLRLKGGLLGTRVLAPQQLSMLATAPPREVLISQLAGGLRAPMAGLATVLSGVLRGLVQVLHARVQQMEQGG